MAIAITLFIRNQPGCLSHILRFAGADAHEAMSDKIVLCHAIYSQKSP